MSLAVSRVICHCLVTEHRSHAVIIRPITRSLGGNIALLCPCGETQCAVYVHHIHMSPADAEKPGTIPCTGASCHFTCECGCLSPVPPRSASLTAAGGCWSTGRGLWRWWPSGWSPAPARTQWNSGWRKYCALPAMRNKEINKKAKAPLMRRSAQLDYNRSYSQIRLGPSKVQVVPAAPGRHRRGPHSDIHGTIHRLQLTVWVSSISVFTGCTCANKMKVTCI